MALYAGISSVDLIAQRTGIAQATVRRACVRLRDMGLVIHEHLMSAGGRRSLWHATQLERWGRELIPMTAELLGGDYKVPGGNNLRSLVR